MKFRSMLAGGDRRSIGNSNDVAAAVLDRPETLPELVECLWSHDRIVRMRAADAAEKVSAQRPELLNRFKAELLGLSEETTEQEVRWHLAMIIPRLALTSSERVRTIKRMRHFLEDRSSIVKTFAIQALVDLTKNAKQRAEVIELLEGFCRTGTPAMKARSRKLLEQIQRPI